MIKNEKQYRITKAQARRFSDALAELTREGRPPNITPRLWQAQRDAAESQLQELQEQIEAYERLSVGQSGRGKDLVFEAVEDLPKTLIRARIASGMTQQGLAHRLGVKDPASPAIRGHGIRKRQLRPDSEGSPSTRPEHAQARTSRAEVKSMSGAGNG